MDYAFLGLLVSIIWWASVVAYSLAGGFAVYVVTYVINEMIQYRQKRRNELH